MVGMDGGSWQPTFDNVYGQSELVESFLFELEALENNLACGRKEFGVGLVCCRGERGHRRSPIIESRKQEA